jgi:hypothetical protein
MTTDAYVDAGLFRKIMAIREGINSGNVNAVWAEQMLQRIVENDRSADFFIRKPWITVGWPGHEEFERILATPSGHHKGFDPKFAELMGRMMRGYGLHLRSDTIDLTLDNMKSL